MENRLHQRIWYGVLAFFTLSFLGVFIYLYNDAYSVKKEEIDIKKYSTESKEGIEKNDWMNLLSSQITQESYLPVPQINIQLDKIDGYDANKKVYTISMSNIDEYKFFCAKQVFDSYNRPYSFVKRGSDLQVSLVLEKSSMYDEIIYELKTYEIDINVK
jgi:hypothetical protein